ncbi:MAG: hypothetical protein M1474_02705 [Candidatus Marsarchaeota archaeon]|jgi:hypothetical protein|nr:hypothetical protein [Candidatus Marsarchaeota archaeon]
MEPSDAISIEATFEPQVLKAYDRNEVSMTLKFSGAAQERYLWCECDVTVASPLSLAPDQELDAAHTRVGILKPGSSLEKRVNLYTRPNNFPDEYRVGITAFFYDDDGAIAERREYKAVIPCTEAERAKP